FRTFLRTCLDRFVANARKADARLKRGGGATLVSFDAAEAERELQAQGPNAVDDFDAYFHREWLRALFAAAAGRLRAACAARDRLAGMMRAPDLAATRYELRGVLGRGGMGVVYLARDTVLDREVALKIVDGAARLEGSRGNPDALAHEARILARLEHPGIVPVHDFGELPDGRQFYAMKRVRGDRLDRWLVGGRDLAERLAVFV